MKIADELSNPYSKSLVSKTLNFSRSLYYYKAKIPLKDKLLSVEIEKIHEEDDTIGVDKMSTMLHRGKKCITRVMDKYSLRARLKKGAKYKYGGRSDEIFPNLANAEEFKDEKTVYSDMFEFRLKDQTKIYGCFALRKETRQILSLVFDYVRDAPLVVKTIKQMATEQEEIIWHSDQGSPYGASITIDVLIEKGYIGSMSRAGTPTDNGYAERFVGIFKQAVVERRKYETIREFLEYAQRWINFYNNERHHDALGSRSPNEFAKHMGLLAVSDLSLSNCSIF